MQVSWSTKIAGTHLTRNKPCSRHEPYAPVTPIALSLALFCRRDNRGFSTVWGRFEVPERGGKKKKKKKKKHTTFFVKLFFRNFRANPILYIRMYTTYFEVFSSIHRNIKIYQQGYVAGTRLTRNKPCSRHEKPVTPIALALALLYGGDSRGFSTVWGRFEVPDRK